MIRTYKYRPPRGLSYELAALSRKLVPCSHPFTAAYTSMALYSCREQTMSGRATKTACAAIALSAFTISCNILTAFGTHVHPRHPFGASPHTESAKHESIEEGTEHGLWRGHRHGFDFMNSTFVDTAKSTILTSQRAAWEQGTAAEGILELDSGSWSVLSKDLYSGAAPVQVIKFSYRYVARWKTFISFVSLRSLQTAHQRSASQLHHSTRRHQKACGSRDR